MGMKIQLNAEAVKAIIDSFDKEQSLELKDFIIKEFTRRHLKDLINHEVIKGLANEVLNAAREEFSAAIGEVKKVGYRREFVLKGSIKKELDTHVRMSISSIIRDEAKKAMEEYDVSTYVKSEVARQLNSKVAQTIQGEIEERWQKVVKATQQ